MVAIFSTGKIARELTFWVPRTTYKRAGFAESYNKIGLLAGRTLQ